MNTFSASPIFSPPSSTSFPHNHSPHPRIPAHNTPPCPLSSPFSPRPRACFPSGSSSYVPAISPQFLNPQSPVPPRPSSPHLRSNFPALTTPQVSIVATFNSIQTYSTLKLTRRVYQQKPHDVTPLSSRTFGTWTFLSAVVRIYAAYHINNAALYDVCMWSYAIAGWHFVSEWLMFGSARYVKSGREGASGKGRVMETNWNTASARG